MKQLWSRLATLWSRLAPFMKQLWSRLAPLPNADQEKQVNLYRIENNSTVISTLCVYQIITMMCLALKVGGAAIWLHIILLLFCCNVMLLWVIYKRNYRAVEKHLLAWMFYRHTIFIHIHFVGGTLVTSNLAQLWRPFRSFGEPISLTWASAENLGALLLTLIIRKEPFNHWILLSHFMGFLITVALQIRGRNQFLALEKSK